MRWSGALAVAMLLLLTTVSPGRAAAPHGPRIAFQMLDRSSSRVEIRTTAPGSGGSSLLFRATPNDEGPAPEFGFQLAWSPTGDFLVFGAQEGRGLFRVSIGGGRPRAIPGTRGGFAPVVSPDGASVAFARARHEAVFRVPKRGSPVIWSYDSATTWTVRLDGTSPRRLTPWRNGLEVLPSSFSSDGSMLAASRFDENDRSFEDAIALKADGSGGSLLASEATRPAFSPDGTRIALIDWLPRVRPRLGRYGFYRGGVSVMRADGSETRFLARTGFSEQSPPSWDPSGERLAYTEGRSVIEINADGSCRRKVLTVTKDLRYFGPVWQPGADREAGRIDC